MASSEDAYAASVQRFKETAKLKETNWAADDEGRQAKVVSIPSAISQTAYRLMGWSKLGLWETCPRCETPSKGVGAGAGVGAGGASSVNVTAGCRMNGDAYGSCLHACNQCGYTNYSSWDEA
jgi:hypothetical protein